MPSQHHTLSDGSGEVPPSNTASLSANTRSFQISKSQSDYVLESSIDNRVFYVQNTASQDEKHGLALHQGTAAEGPVIAACEFKSRDIQICLGDPNNASDTDVKWENLSKSLIKTQYAWETQSTQGHSEIAGNSLVWKKTKSISVDDIHPSEAGSNNLKLVEADSDDAMAVFTSDESQANSGKLEIRVEFGEAFDLLVLISCVAIIEKAF